MYILRHFLAGSLFGAILFSPAGIGGNRTSYTAAAQAYPDQSGQYGGDQDDDPEYYDNYDQPVEYAQEAPPPLPEYEQPVCPGQGYMWTPGYWYWGSEGFYWVPGAWVSAPYSGALWTPGYWSFLRGRYGWHRGFWGRHVGYYGGINYGYGYTGYGYQGGRWDGDRFAYNRAVNNVNVTVIHNVYNYRVVNHNVNRVSYNGPGGVRVRPRAEEVRAFREPHNPPMSTQLQHAQQAQRIRENFARVNHGRPQTVVDRQPLQADRNVKAPAPVSTRQPAPSNGRNGAAPRPGQPVLRGEPARPDARRPEQRGNGGGRPETRPNEATRRNQPTAHPAEPPRAAPARPVAPMRTQPAPREQQPAPRQGRPEQMQRPQHEQAPPDRQAPERHAQPAPERQAPHEQRQVPQERPAPVQHPQAVPQRPERPVQPPHQEQQRPNRQEQQRPNREVRPAPARPAPTPHAAPQEHRQAPPKQDEKRPH